MLKSSNPSKIRLGMAFNFSTKTVQPTSPPIKDLKYPGMARDFIKDRLYASNEGYFNRQNTQVGMLKEPIEFNKLLGYYAYRKELETKYPQNAWVTPSEVFFPYYGYMIANYISEVWDMQDYKRFSIVEIGPGTGALAQSTIEYLSSPMFKRKPIFDYHGVEISPVLCSILESRLQKSHPKLIESNTIKIHNESIFEYTHKQKGPVFVIGMEILDNMPHDRLYRDSENPGEPWKYQTKVEKIESEDDEQEILQEFSEPITDSLGKLYMEIESNLPHMDEIDLK